MATLELQGLRKSFGATQVLRQIDLSLDRRRDAGHRRRLRLRQVHPAAPGRRPGNARAPAASLIGGRDVTGLDPSERDIAMVFQNYALYPHMSVFDNMAYGLRIRGLSRGEITRKVEEAATLLGLDALLARKPRQLSGGQRQRVAMGRAIVRDPKLFLFDEPLSNLDAKLRVQMRAEIRKLQRRLGVTSLYVTHDQVEAMTLGDRLLILHEGQPAQLATPMEVFERPADTYVAGFIGSPTMNFLPGRLVDDGTAVQLDAGPLVPLQGRRAGDRVTLGIRPEHLTLGGDGLTLTVDLVEPLGSETLIHGRIVGRDAEAVVVKVPGAVVPSETVTVAVQTDQAHVFDASTGVRINPVG